MTYRVSAAALAMASSMALGQGVAAQNGPSLNFYGATGLIDMPSGEAQPDGQLSISTGIFGPVTRTTLSFQLTPRISASFRFLGISSWNDNFCPPRCTGINQFSTYYDRSFDIRFKALNESRYLPSVTIGLQDFAGTGVLSGEYIAATKTITPSFKVTAGLGWGRLGSHGDIGSPFGARPATNIGFGGNFNANQWFRGPAAPFGGIEWNINDNWTFKGEYSSDNYDLEDGQQGTFRKKSPYNFGIEYSPNKAFRVGAYYLYGSQFGIAGHFVINPKERLQNSFSGTAPTSVALRPSRATSPGDWATNWVDQADAGAILAGNMDAQLNGDGIFVERLGLTAGTAQVRIRNTTLDNTAQMVGRTARVMSQVLPASVEVFEIVPVVSGMATAKVTIRRSDLEQLEFSPDAIEQMRDRTQVTSAERSLPGAYVAAAPDPFTWTISPFLRTRLFDQRSPFKVDLALRGTASYQITPNLKLSGSVTQRLAGNLKDRPPLPPRGRLQPVRSAVYFYDLEGTTALEKLALHWTGKLSPDLYGRVSLGYLERMFGGVSTEVLWKPVGSRFALGAEVNYVRQRAPDGGFGFTLPASMYTTDAGPVAGPASYSVLTGHVSAYYELSRGFHAQLDVGRYLAGDIGATLSFDREFENGWRVGAFATKTNVSSRDFGAGSFDKGIRITVPFNWLLGKPSRQSATAVLRPFGRDGGARLDVDNRLYEQVRGYHAPSLADQAGRFWK